MNNQESILCRVLAETDAVWLPMRDFGGRRPANTYFARRDYPTVGVFWRSEEASEAGRKESQRALEALCAAGLLKAYRPRRYKTLGVRLTDEGEARARALCGLPDLSAGMASLAEVARRTEVPGRWIPETALAGVDYGTPGSGKKFALVEDMALPALVRGWLESNADIQGHVWYRVTAAGSAALDAAIAKTTVGKAEGHGAADLPAAQKAARALYLDCLSAAQTRLAESEAGDRREIGFIPLPVAFPGAARAGNNLPPAEEDICGQLFRTAPTRGVRSDERRPSGV